MIYCIYQTKENITMVSPTEEIDENVYYRLPKFCKMCGLRYQTIRNRINNGIITDYKYVNGRYFINKSYLENIKKYEFKKFDIPDGYISRREIMSELGLDTFTMSRFVTTGIFGVPKKIKQMIYFSRERYESVKNNFYTKEK